MKGIMSGAVVVVVVGGDSECGLRCGRRLQTDEQSLRAFPGHRHVTCPARPFVPDLNAFPAPLLSLPPPQVLTECSNFSISLMDAIRAAVQRLQNVPSKNWKGNKAAEDAITQVSSIIRLFVSTTVSHPRCRSLRGYPRNFRPHPRPPSIDSDRFSGPSCCRCIMPI